MSSGAKRVELSAGSSSRLGGLVKHAGIGLAMIAGGVGGVGMTGTAMAQDAGRAFIAETDASGARIVPASGPWAPGTVFSPRAVLWTYDNQFFAIPQSVAFSPTEGLLWAGQALNNEVVQNFQYPGDGTVNNSFPVVTNSTAAVTASAGSSLVAVVDGPEYVGPFTIRGYDPEGQIWSFDFPGPFIVGGSKQIRVSRDGSTVAVGGNYYDQDLQQSFARVYILEGASGEIRSEWNGSGGVGGVDLTDDGSLCFVANDSLGQVVDTATGTATFTASGSGGGASFQISGGGETLVLGGFNLAVYTRDGEGPNYTRVINFTDSTQWFGWGSAVSREGNTVVAISHNYGNGYLDTYTRAWDVPSQTLLGTYQTMGSGSYQDSAAGAVISDDGSVFAVGSWGAQDENHPEVMVFDRSVNMIGSIDTRGSIFALAMTPDGSYVASGNKGAHANAFGNGGDVTLLQLDAPCLADFNGDDFIDFFDYSDYVLCFEEGECPPGKTADFNGDDFVDFFDYADFVTAFEAGC